MLTDHRRLVRELDVLLNGDGAAQQASLCDIVSQVRRERIKAQAPAAAGDTLDAKRYRSHRAALTSVNTAWLDNVTAALEAMDLDPDDADALPTADQVDAAFDAAIAAQQGKENA